ncbi:DUF3224 domain-containing protein [Herpetosiphon llansteffanensis]|uniref:DUF3224 domain-containing protein n=1 Tax=Herpetosiphon llansteffanensis TaxID=2094568 RepID=UPI000D7C5234|nr:DUF3224 domain-containing protein [Herpetosiphon llansteffanensis]
MSTTANATFSVVQWDEKPYHEQAGEGKTTRSHVIYRYEGDLVGESTVEYLMHYPEAADATYVGLQRFVGTLAGKTGSFVLKHNGTANAVDVFDSIEVVAGSATGELAGLRGSGKLALSGHAEGYPFALEYEFV